MRVVGDLRLFVALGMIVRSAAICCFGSCFVFSISAVILRRFSWRISFRSLFLYLACCCMFSVVGFFIRRSWSVCCFAIIRLYLGVHQGFRLCFGIISCCSMVCCIVVCMMRRRSEGVVWRGVCMCAMMRACCSVGKMVCFWFVYLFVERVFCVFRRFLGVGR